MEDEIVLNGKTITENQLVEKKEEVQKQAGVKLVEVSPGVFKTRLQD